MSATAWLFSLCPASMPPMSTEPAGRFTMWMLAALLLLGESVMRGHQQDLEGGGVRQVRVCGIRELALLTDLRFHVVLCLPWNVEMELAFSKLGIWYGQRKTGSETPQAFLGSRVFPIIEDVPHPLTSFLLCSSKQWESW